jgi:hypothetical protein
VRQCVELGQQRGYRWALARRRHAIRDTGYGLGSLDIALALVTNVVTLVVGVLLGAGYTIYLRRPKLVAAGGGGGGGHPFHICQVRIRNDPGLFGLRLSPTMLLGRHVHDYIEKGLTVDRNPAKDCTAWIYDADRALTTLHWRPLGGTDSWTTTTTLDSGDEVELMLFARLHEEPDQYFLFSPADPGDPSSPPRLPDSPAQKFRATRDTRTFRVQVNYSYGRQRLSFPVNVRLDYNGMIYVEYWAGAGSF